MQIYDVCMCLLFSKVATGQESELSQCVSNVSNPVNAAREARLAPRAADMGREEQDWLQNVDGGEKQKRCCQQRCKQLQGEQQERKRLFLSRTFSCFAEFANWALCLFTSSGRLPSI